MHPAPGSLNGRRIVAGTLAAVVLASGAFFVSQRAQVVASELCISLFGPFFAHPPTTYVDGSSGQRKNSMAAFPDGRHFIKTSGTSTVTLFALDDAGVITRHTDLTGYTNPAVTVLSNTQFVIVFQDGTTNGIQAFAQVGTFMDGRVTMGQRMPFATVPPSFETRALYAVDVMNDQVFAIVTNLPTVDAKGDIVEKSLQAIVGTTGGFATQLTPLGASVVSPSPLFDPAVIDFDVAGVNTTQFIVGFHGSTNGYVRGTIATGQITFAPKKSLPSTASEIDLDSSFMIQRKVAMSYKDGTGTAARIFAGEIVVSGTSEQYAPISIAKAGDIVLGSGVTWINEETYIAGFGVQNSTTQQNRNGTFIRQGTTAGSTSFGAEIQVTSDLSPEFITLAGINGPPGRIVVSQQTNGGATTGLRASYCGNTCGNGELDAGEECDDGNQVNTDQCSNQCRLPTCTDGIDQVGEECDAAGGDPICDIRFCGNGFIDPGEQCDPKIPAWEERCSPLCRIRCDEDFDCPSGQCAGGECVDLCGNGVIDPPVCVSSGGGLDCPPPDPGDMKVVNLPGGVFPNMHTSADLNNDGKLDVIVSNYVGASGGWREDQRYTATIEGFLNQGNGVFSSRIQLGTFNWNNGGGNRGMDAFDMDKDGDADILFYDSTSQGMGLFALRNDNMTFVRTGKLVDIYAFHLRHGDINRDNDPDLGISGFPPVGSSTYGAYYMNAGNGITFSGGSRLDGSNGHAAPAFGDMDGDGDMDFVNIGGYSEGVGNYGYLVMVYLSRGDGTFEPGIEMYRKAANPNPATLVLADMNRDGKLDAITGDNGPSASVVLGDGNGGSISGEDLQFSFAPRLLAVADPTADGIPDIVFGAGAGTEGQNLWYAAGNGDGTFEVPVRFLTLTPPANGPGNPPFNNTDYRTYDLRSADYDGDGRQDLSVVHGSYSNSASVILFRSSVDGCTEIPPEITCSQGELCDDGIENGLTGMCTRQCTFCGNEVIDTVDGVEEECDEGDQNGEDGSGCSLQCAIVLEPRLGCIGENSCALVPGDSNAPLCNSGDDCTCDPEDPTCVITHPGCVDNACTDTTDPNAPFCGSDADCTECPDDDPLCHNQCNVLVWQCVEQTLGGCIECDSKYLKCVNEACTVVEGDEENECSTPDGCIICNNDNHCDEDDGETCSCGDCASEPRCGEFRPGCLEEDLCALVPVGSDAPLCDSGDDCTCDPEDPTCIIKHNGCVDFACTETTDPNAPFCEDDVDCAPCPPENPLCHEQCNQLIWQCVATTEGKCLECDGNLRCVGQACAIVDDDTGTACLTPDDCINECTDDGFCTDDETCECNDCIAVERCDGCNDNGICEPELEESCSCGDCAGEPQCYPGSKCERDDAGAWFCTPELGGQPRCTDPTLCCDENDPTCMRPGCVAVLSCGQVPMSDTTTPSCAIDEDCCNPDDPLCKHSICHYEYQSCMEFEDQGLNTCDPNDPNDPDCWYGVCEDQKCKLYFGDLASECSDTAECALCGNGIVDDGESCDDGNDIDDDDCNNNCQRTCVDDSFCPCDEELGICENVCGNHVIETGESCDEGLDNRNVDRDGWPISLKEWWCKDPTCLVSSCFDRADNEHDSFTDDMDPGCWSYNLDGMFGMQPRRSWFASLLAQSGGRRIDPVPPEEFLAGKDDEDCPDGMEDMGQFCGLICDPGDICPTGDLCPENGVCPPSCGNQIIDFDLGEECDDGNLDDNDACTNQCRLAPCVGPNCPRCGDGIYHPDLGEQCDGTDPSPIAVEQGCSENCRLQCNDDDDCEGTCDLEIGLCIPPVCGDKKVNQDWERCDDGDLDNTNECNNSCQPTCDEDSDCESGRCDKPIQVCFPPCGNGHVDADEMCDDGNLVDDDACNNQCLLHCTDDLTCDCDEEKGLCRKPCGNGRLDPGEGCDDGNTNDRDECSNRCQVRCRPGTMCPDQQACPQNGLCPMPGFCGDGIVDGTAEQCDDGNNIETDGCNTQCRARCSQNLECPNGLLCVGEECTECTNSLQCDSGFCVDGRCRAALPICGNGQVEPGEVCDDANADDGDGCSSACLFPIDHACVASAQCSTHLCEGSVCTACQDSSQCVPAGLRCTEGNCLFGGLQCGDGTVQAGEACDDGNIVDQDECTSACLLPFGAECSHALQCASTICSGGECTPCRDDAECASGTRCAIGMCLTDAQMSLIPNICGNGLLEADEECDDGNNAYGDGCTPGCYIGNSPSRLEVAANMTVHMPFGEGYDGGANGGYGSNGNLHAGAGDGLSDTGPATIAVMAAGAAAGTAWVRRRYARKKH